MASTPAELVAAVPLPLWLLVDAAATYRLTRLLTRDTFPPTRRLREYVVRRWPKASLSELAVCPWCVSFWIGAGVLAARMVAPDAWTLFALPLAYSAAAGLLSMRD